MRRPDNQGDRLVRSSDLAKLGYCERKTRYENLLGARATPAQASAQIRGRDTHSSFHREGIELARAPRRQGCCVASKVLGESTRTGQLRSFRDDVMRRAAIGRLLVLGYYAVSPAMCRMLNRWPAAVQALRPVLTALAVLAFALIRCVRLARARGTNA